jgi:hypothetical protein
MSPSTAALNAKPSREWLVKRINQLNIARQANLDADGLTYFASALSGFSQAALDEAIGELERESVEDYKSRFPDLRTLQDRCRRATHKAERRPLPDCKLCENMRMSVKRREDGSTFAVDCECVLTWRKSKAVTA